MSVSLDDIPEVAKSAWLRLRRDLQAILGDDLLAMWAYGGTIGSDRPLRPADLDTHVIVRRLLDGVTAPLVEQALDAIADRDGVEWDVWFIVVDDARRPEAPPHAFREGRRDTSWALHRAHWLGGRYVNIYGPEPAEIVAAPTWPELEVDLDRELEHIERHVFEGDTDLDEAAYAILNGSRILHAIETRNVVLSKRAAGIWALEQLPDRWHPAIRAALHSYDGQATPAEGELLASEMPSFVDSVRERLPAVARPPQEPIPRWSGY